jgi:hypothetical protein
MQDKFVAVTRAPVARHGDDIALACSAATIRSL